MRATSVQARYSAGDLVATCAACALIAVVTGWMIPGGWSHWPAMAVGMVAGMALSIPCWLLAGQCLGMIEPMLQIMLAGMIAGMVSAMAAVGEAPPGIAALALFGLACGAATWFAVSCADWALRNWGQD